MKKLNIITIILMISTTMIFANWNEMHLEKDTELNFARDGFREIERIEQYYDFTTEEWMNAFRHTSEYLSDELLSVRYGDNWEAEAWGISNKVVYTYENGLEIEMLHQIYENSQWENSLMIIKEYETDDKITSESYYSWDNNEWNNYRNVLWFYEGGNCILRQNEYLEMEELPDSSRTTYTYDANDNLITSISENKDYGEWRYSSKADYYYYNDILSYIESFYYPEDSWILHVKNSYTYDENDNILERLMQFWHNEEWENELRSVFEYDEYNNETRYQKEHFEDDVWTVLGARNRYYDEHQNMILQTEEDWDEGYGIVDYQYIYAYESFTDAENHTIPETTFTNHPNPFNPSTTISFSFTTEYTENAEIQIYNIKGQKVDQISVVSGQTSAIWNAERFGSGIYFYKLSVNGKTEAVKKCMLLK
jgi:hypothetical protein